MVNLPGSSEAVLPPSGIKSLLSVSETEKPQSPYSLKIRTSAPSSTLMAGTFKPAGARQYIPGPKIWSPIFTLPSKTNHSVSASW